MMKGVTVLHSTLILNQFQFYMQLFKCAISTSVVWNGEVYFHTSLAIHE